MNSNDLRDATANESNVSFGTHKVMMLKKTNIKFRITRFHFMKIYGLLKNLIYVFQGIVWKMFLKISPYGVSTFKCRQAYNQVSRQSSNDKINSSKIVDHVRRLIGGRMQWINRRCTRASNVLV